MRTRWIIGLALLAMVMIGTTVVGGALWLARHGGLPIVAGVATAQTAQADDARDQGIVVTHVEPDSPAAEAGIVRGDILLRVGETEVNEVRDLRAALADLDEAATEVALTVLHGDETRTLTATLGEQRALGLWGVGPTAGKRGGIFLDGGWGRLEGNTLIVAVEPGSPAAEAGLQEGDVIEAVDGEALSPEQDLADRIAAHAPGDTVTLTVRSAEGETRDVAVTLGENEDGGAFLGVRYAPGGPHFFFRHDGPLTDTLPFEHDFTLPFDMMPPHVDDFTLPEGITETLYVRDVVADSPAAEAGLEQGDRILALDGEPVTAPREVVEAIRAHAPGDAVTLTLQRGEDEPFDVTVTLGENENGGAYLGIGLGFVRRMEGPGRLDEFREFWDGRGAPFDFQIPDFQMPDLPDAAPGSSQA